MPIFEGFECGSWTVLARSVGDVQWNGHGNNAPTITAVWAHTGSRAGGLYSILVNAGETPYVTLSVQQRYVYVSMRRNTGTLSRGLQFQQLGVDAAFVTWNATGYIEIRRGTSAGTLLATSAASYGSTVGQTLNIEVDAVLANGVAGTITVYVEGVQAVTAAGTDTTAATTDGWDGLGLAGGNTATTTNYDDLVFMTAAEGRLSFIPYVQAFKPVRNATPLEMTPSTGTNWQNVDTIPVTSTTPYNEADTAGQEDMYTPAPLSFDPRYIKGVKVQAYAARDGTITTANVKLTTALGTTVSSGATVLGSAAQAALVEVYADTDPDTLVDWLAPELNAIKIGAEFP